MSFKLTNKFTYLVIVLSIIFTITKALTNPVTDFCETRPFHTDCLEHVVYKQDESHSFTRDKLIQGLKEKTFKRIVFLTGAGISVSAGIPDFRSKTGIYSQLGDCDLPHPEAIFELSYFKHHPETFYKVAKVLMSYNPKPTIAHYFIKMLADENVLSVDFTQNVDGLEIAAGLDPSLLIEAHGHTRSAHCAVCHKEKSIDELKKHIQEGKVYRCECSGPVKPDIIFFGEQLPVSFFEAHKKVAEADLVIVMGTSLRVAPFSYLIHLVHEQTPIVLINRENSAIKRQNFLFLEGDIDELVMKIIIDVEWEKKLERVKLIDE